MLHQKEIILGAIFCSLIASCQRSKKNSDSDVEATNPPVTPASVPYTGPWLSKSTIVVASGSSTKTFCELHSKKIVKRLFIDEIDSTETSTGNLAGYVDQGIQRARTGEIVSEPAQLGSEYSYTAIYLDESAQPQSIDLGSYKKTPDDPAEGGTKTTNKSSDAANLVRFIDLACQ